MVDPRSLPDQHLDPTVAAEYDASVAGRFDPSEIDPAVDCLAGLAADGIAVEFAIGTGRLALPLAATGVEVRGIDASQPMVDELRRKPGGADIPVAIGDMTSTSVADDASLVYLVFNTIQNLRSQEQQVACFHNAAAHLAPGGHFLVETGVPSLAALPPGETIRPFSVTPEHFGFDEFVDTAEQILVSHHYFISGDRVRNVAGAFRYVWPSELDLMAQLAGMQFESRWSDWQGGEFTGDSDRHISVWRKI